MRLSAPTATGLRPQRPFPLGRKPRILRLAAALAAAAILGSFAASLAERFAPSDQELAVGLATGLLAAGIALIALQLRSGDFASPLSALGLLLTLDFGLRPLYLLANHRVLSAYVNPSSPREALSNLQSQELVWFFAVKTGTPPIRAILVGVALGVVFAASFIVGHARGQVRRRTTLARPAWLEPAKLRNGVVIFLAASLLAQAYLLATAGGLSAALAGVNTQETVQLPGRFGVFVVLTCGIVALMVWLVALPPRSPGTWAMFSALLAERSLFGLVTGSRSSAVMPLVACAVAAHYGRRRWRLLQVAIGVGVLLAVTTTFAVFREATRESTVRQAQAITRESLPGPGAIANDFTEFDALIEMIGSPAQFAPRDGRRLLEGSLSLVPRALYIGGKPPTGDIQLRARLWGSSVGLAGRPFTVVGELWWDLRWLGVALGGLLIGYVIGRIRMAVARLPSKEMRGCWEAVLLLAFASLLFGGYDLGASVAFQYAVPLFVLTSLAASRSKPSFRETRPQTAPTSPKCQAVP